MGATLNGSPCVSVRLLMPYRGVWIADVDVDPALASALPTSGPAALVIGTPPGPVATLLGVLDPLASGSFVATSRVRVLGGKGGWQQIVTPQQYAPGLSTAVYNAVAAQVLEEVADLLPTSFAGGFLLAAGPASQVFGDNLWWVDPVTGITNVGPVRPPAIPDTTLEIMTWDPLRKVAEVSCDALVLPGTPLVDTRIGESPVLVRDVEQTFGPKGSRATCFCSANAVSPLQAAFQSMIRQFAGVGFLAIRLYTVVAPGAEPNSWSLQAVSRGTTGAASPLPDALNMPGWTGVSGATATLTPGSQVLLGFIAGDPKQPVILSYAPGVLPLELVIDAETELQLGMTVTKTIVDAVAELVLGQVAALIAIGQASSKIQIGGAAGLPAARVTDAVVAGPFAGTITGPGSTTTTIE